MHTLRLQSVGKRRGRPGFRDVRPGTWDGPLEPFRFRDARPSRFQRFQVPVPRRWPLICVTARFQVPVPAAAGGSRFQAKVNMLKSEEKFAKNRPILRFFVKVVPWPICNQMSIDATFPTQTSHKGPPNERLKKTLQVPWIGSRFRFRTVGPRFPVVTAGSGSTTRFRGGSPGSRFRFHERARNPERTRNHSW